MRGKKEIEAAIRLQNRKMDESLNMVASAGVNLSLEKETEKLLLNTVPIEGYRGKRFYKGMESFDLLEDIACEISQRVFGFKYINLQPLSGTNANLATYIGLLNQNDAILAPMMKTGGHLSHVSKLSVSSKLFRGFHYGMNYLTGEMDKKAAEEIMAKEDIKLAVIGFSAWPLIPDFKFFRELCSRHNAIMVADIAHISGIVASGFVDLCNPDVVTTSSYKTFCSTKGGVVLTNNEDYHNRIGRALFPGIQGTSDAYQVAQKALALAEFEEDYFKKFMRNVLNNAKALALSFKEEGIRVLCNGTETHMVIIQHDDSKEAANLLEENKIICNDNICSIDNKSFGSLRFGTICNTARGLDENDHKIIGYLISKIIKGKLLKDDYDKLLEIINKQLKLEEVTERLKVIGCKPI